VATEAKSRIRTALVTGAARRIGAAIARTLHERGCRVVLHYRDSRDEAAVLADILNRERPDSACLVQGDLAAGDGPEKLAARVREVTGHLDILVNNASRFYPTPVGEVTPGVWKDLMGSNLRGPFFLCQALLPELRAASGVIVNVLDIHAGRPMQGHAVYCIAKAGLAMMTRALARDLGPRIRVNGVAPGAILWPENEPPERIKRQILARAALGRLGDPADVAAAVAFLALDASYVTGQVLAVDGGASLDA
jgi:pteridine reductase